MTKREVVRKIHSKFRSRGRNELELGDLLRKLRDGWYRDDQDGFRAFATKEFDVGWRTILSWMKFSERVEELPITKTEAVMIGHTKLHYAARYLREDPRGAVDFLLRAKTRKAAEEGLRRMGFLPAEGRRSETLSFRTSPRTAAKVRRSIERASKLYPEMTDGDLAAMLILRGARGF